MFYWKKCLLLIIVFLCFCQKPSLAKTQETIITDNKITISGVCEYNDAPILYDELTITAFSSQGEKTVGNIAFTTQTTTDFRGRFNISYLMDDDNAQTGMYIVEITDGENFKESTSFYYATLKDKKNLINDINTGDATKILQILTNNDYIKILNIKTDGFYSKLFEENKLKVADAIAKSDFNGDVTTVTNANKVIGEIATFYNNQVQMVYKNQMTSDVVSKLNTLSDSEFLNYVLLNNDIIGLDTSNLFTLLKEEQIKVSAKTIARKSVITDFETLKKVMYEEIAVACVNCVARATAIEQMPKVLQNNKIGLGFTLDNCPNDKKQTIYIALCGKNFLSAAQIKSQVDSILNGKDEQPPINSGGGGSTGSGGGKTTISERPSPIVPPEKTENFVDLQNVSWAVESINALYEKGIISGYGDKKFFPDNNVTREEFVKMLVIALDCLDKNEKVEFSDVNADEWYYPYVGAGVKCGIVKGKSDEIFGVGDNITREDMAVLVARALQYKGVNTETVRENEEFKDFQSVAPYAKDSVSAMKNMKILNGDQNNCFNPQNFTTRAECAKVIYLLLNLI